MGKLYSDKNELWIEERIKEFIESHPTLEIDEKRIRHFLFSYLLLKENVSGKDVVIGYNFDEPTSTSGCITISGKTVKFSGGAFSITARYATNFEVYPRVNGTLRMNFTFYKLASRKGGENE
jgi:hypothetical protein